MIQKTVDEYLLFVVNQIKKQYFITPSAVVLKSFYVMEVIKPDKMVVRMFDWLLSITEKCIKDYKAIKI